MINWERRARMSCHAGILSLAARGFTESKVWHELRPDRLRAAKRLDYMVTNSHFTRARATSFDNTFAAARVCWLGTAEDDPP